MNDVLLKRRKRIKTPLQTIRYHFKHNGFRLNGSGIATRLPKADQACFWE
jgi:hypothetical protein